MLPRHVLRRHQAMEGKYYEVDVHTLETTLLGDARKELGIRGSAHFKGAYTAQGRYVVANNSYSSSKFGWSDFGWPGSSASEPPESRACGASEAYGPFARGVASEGFFFGRP